MPMPRTKVQGLGAHVSSMANSARSYAFGGGGDRGSQQSKNLKGGAGLLGDSSSSDSSSSDSDSDSDISDREGTKSFLSKISAATATKKSKANESSAHAGAKNPAPEGAPKNTISAEPAQKNGASTLKKPPASSSSHSKSAAIKKEAVEDDSEDDTTSSDSSSEEESAQGKKQEQAAKSAATKTKPRPQDDSTTSDSSSSDSEDSDEEAEKKSVPAKTSSKKQSAPAPKEDSSSSESSDSEESGDEEGAAGAKLAGKSSKKTAPVPETVDDSSSESDSDSDGEVENAQSSVTKSSNTSAQSSKPTKVATKAAVSTSKSESDSDSESGEEKQNLKTKTAPKKVAANAVLNGNVKSRDAPSATKASKVSKGAPGESSSEENSDVEMADESFALARTDNAHPGAAEEFIREGFQLRKASKDTQASEVLAMFKKAKQEGKQIWYFTTPASVPISVIEKMEFPMKNAQTGDSIVSHDGVDYGVDLGASGKPSAFQILVPAKEGTSYGIIDRPVDHTMHLKRITQLAATDFAAKPRPQISYSKPPRAQPAGLKRQFTPIGVPAPILPPPVPNPSKRSADVSMLDAASDDKDESQEPSNKSKKRKLADEGAKTTKGDKKSKKVKTASEAQSAKASPGAPLSGSRPVKKSSPVPVPNLGGRAPSLSQPTPSVSTPATGKSKKSKSTEKADGTPGAATPSSKTKKVKNAKSDSSIRQTPIPVPKIPGMKK